MAAAGGDGGESLEGLVVKVYGDAGHGVGCFISFIFRCKFG